MTIEIADQRTGTVVYRLSLLGLMTPDHEGSVAAGFLDAVRHWQANRELPDADLRVRLARY